MHFSFESNFAAPISDRAIFAVDDEEAGRALFLQALREAGVKNPCRFFPNGEDMIEALLAVLKGAPPPLVCFLDLKMPGMCGLDVLRWIRLQDALDEVSVVMLASAEDSIGVGDVLRHGAQCCAKKFPEAGQIQKILGEAERFSSVASGRSAFDVPCNLLRVAAPIAS